MTMHPEDSPSAQASPWLQHGLNWLQQWQQAAQAGAASPWSAAGGAAPTSWLTPAQEPEQLVQRIAELRAVQFWLEQNLSGIGSAIQALEVQRLTLESLRQMQASFADLAQAGATATAATAAAPSPSPQTPPDSTAERPDPLAWWGALGQQFQTLAQQAMQPAAAPTPSTPTAAKTAARRPRRPSSTGQAKAKAAAAPPPAPRPAVRKRKPT